VRRIDEREVVTLRGSTLPLCFLARLFELGEPDAPAVERAAAPVQLPAAAPGTPRLIDTRRTLGDPGTTGRKRYVVVVAVGQRRLGLVVDTLIGEQDVVIKALGPSLKAVRGFAGATELGDQRIGLVLDAPALLEELATPQAVQGRAEARGPHA
jgi:two-component system, chemotaxis family, sensor kinase CheA